MIALPVKSRPPWFYWTSAVPVCGLCRQWTKHNDRFPAPCGFVCHGCERRIDTTRNKLTRYGSMSPKWMTPELRKWLKRNPIDRWATVEMTMLDGSGTKTTPTEVRCPDNGTPCKLRRKIDGIVIECELLDVNEGGYVVLTKAGKRTISIEAVEVA